MNRELKVRLTTKQVEKFEEEFVYFFGDAALKELQINREDGDNVTIKSPGSMVLDVTMILDIIDEAT